ncbi:MULTISPECIES: hypothetical protein [unclassified Rathayibacter]|uniref:hypothetical protein n=1 Tax=unclassified Rathayibacter TaxID=2609250 RepID=UPI00188A5C3D|nr:MULTISPECIES: hypothetical protein [unclassified Rathayibacter]MBF4461166.1 hypothetical protein [Rathayibacter sp. VKM Ac-2879]MBF4502577.1 hypothetical protein [Rathayibacter sp. VKM Ac-2878]
MKTERKTRFGVIGLVSTLALSGCTWSAGTAPEGATPSIAGSPTSAVQPLGAVTLPEGASAAVRWTDQIGAPSPQTVYLSGNPLHITVSVACDSEDSEVKVEVVGVMTSGSSCSASPRTTRSGTGGGNTGTMHVSVDQAAEIRITTVPVDAHWSGAVSTGG